MKTSSAKAKGRVLQQWVAQKLSELTGYAWGYNEMISPREMGQSGTDIRLVADAKDDLPYSIEAKNQERWSVHKWIDQAIANQEPGTDWLLICKRNRKQPVVVMDAERFFAVLDRLPGKRKGA